MDPHYFGKLDPDPHLREELDPYPDKRTMDTHKRGVEAQNRALECL
jgi:hypothetical protein